MSNPYTLVNTNTEGVIEVSYHSPGICGEETPCLTIFKACNLLDSKKWCHSCMEPGTFLSQFQWISITQEPSYWFSFLFVIKEHKEFRWYTVACLQTLWNQKGQVLEGFPSVFHAADNIEYIWMVIISMKEFKILMHRQFVFETWDCWRLDCGWRHEKGGIWKKPLEPFH